MIKAWLIGIRRGLGHPGIVIWLWLVNFLVALPLAGLMADSIRDSVGASQAAERLQEDFDMEWFSEFQATARGVERTFGPTLIRGGAFFQNLENWVTGGLFDGFSPLLWLGLAYGLLWALFLGGVLARYADQEARFFPSSGHYFFRFVRLAVLSLPLYWLVYKLHHWLYGRVEQLTRDVIVERTVLFYSLLVFGLTAFLLSLVHLCFSYAKIATVVDGRRSMLFAAFRGIAFVLKNPGRTVGLYLLMVAVSVTLLSFYAWVAPGADQSTSTGVLFAFVFGQLFLVARLIIRLSLYGGELELYRTLGRRPDLERSSPVHAPSTP